MPTNAGACPGNLCHLFGNGACASGLRIEGSPWHLLLLCGIPFLAGAATPITACVNNVLAKHVGTSFRAMVLHYSVGTLVVSTVSIIEACSTEQRLEISGGEPWMWTGGLLGSVFVGCNLVGLPVLGAAAFTTLLLASQLVTSFCLDATGAFGFPAIPPAPTRIAGILLAIVSAVFLQFTQRGKTFTPARKLIELEAGVSEEGRIHKIETLIRGTSALESNLFFDRPCLTESLVD